MASRLDLDIFSIPKSSHDDLWKMAFATLIKGQVAGTALEDPGGKHAVVQCLATDIQPAVIIHNAYTLDTDKVHVGNLDALAVCGVIISARISVDYGFRLARDGPQVTKGTIIKGTME